MKIALCISGQPRFIEESFPYIKKNILDCNDNVDVFLHCWFNVEETGKKFSNTSDTIKERGNGIIKGSTIELLKEMYKPVSILAEPQEDFSYSVKPEYTAARDKTNPFATFSMWESIARCNNLKTLHEEKNAFIYDVVIKSRFDLKIETPIRPNAMKIQSLYTSGYNKNISLVEDMIFYTQSKVMNTIANLPFELDSHFKTIKFWNNESLLARHCIVHNINIIRCPEWKLSLALGKRNIFDTLWSFRQRVINRLKL